MFNVHGKIVVPIRALRYLLKFFLVVLGCSCIDCSKLVYCRVRLILSSSSNSIWSNTFIATLPSSKSSSWYVPEQAVIKSHESYTHVLCADVLGAWQLV